jgi:hypothetical protein
VRNKYQFPGLIIVAKVPQKEFELSDSLCGEEMREVYAPIENRAMNNTSSCVPIEM